MKILRSSLALMIVLDNENDERNTKVIRVGISFMDSKAFNIP